MNGEEVENCGLITRRDRSELYKIRRSGVFYCWKILTDDNRFKYTYEQAYKNYSDLRDKSNLVKVCHTWRDKENRFNVLMEWLEGYRRLEYRETPGKWTFMIDIIEDDLIKQGYFIIDLAPINFMIKDGDIKMIDLDTLAKLTDFPVDPHKMISELSWYGSRVLKHRSGRER